MLRIALTEGIYSVMLPLSLLFISLVSSVVHLFLKSRASFLNKFSLAFACLCVFSQTMTLVLRWFAGGHFPVVGRFEAFFFFSYCLVAVYIYLSWRIKETGLGLTALLIMGFVFLLPCIWTPKPVAPLTPFLDTPLFSLHVLFSFFGYALFAASACLAGEFLAAKAKNSFVWIERCISLGFSFFTFCMIAGAIWAYIAWESYWMWNLKGIWSFSLWLFYAGLIHHRFISADELSLKRRAIYAIAGFCLALFTFLGLGLLMKGTHRL